MLPTPSASDYSLSASHFLTAIDPLIQAILPLLALGLAILLCPGVLGKVTKLATEYVAKVKEEEDRAQYRRERSARRAANRKAKEERDFQAWRAEVARSRRS